MHLQKGFEILINGFNKSCACKYGWKLVLIGDGPEKKNLFKLVNKLNLRKYVKILNFTEPRKWYKSCGIFALLSRYEGMPNVVLEASSFKLPIIVSKGTGGALDFIINNKTGLVTKNNSTNEVSKKINILVENKSLRKKLGINAFKKIKPITDYEKIYSYWKEIIL